MNERLETILADYLKKSLKVMLCSEKPALQSKVTTLIQQYSQFSVTPVPSVGALKQCLKSKDEWHAVLIDSRCTFSQELFTNIRGNFSWMPIIVLRDLFVEDFSKEIYELSHKKNVLVLQNVTPNNVKSGESRNITVCPLGKLELVVPTLQMLCIKKRLFPKKMPTGIGEVAVKTLFHENPVTVDEWIELLGIQRSKLHRLIHSHAPYSPRKIVLLYHAYRIVFNKSCNPDKTCIDDYAPHSLNDQAKNEVFEYILSQGGRLFSSTE